MRDRLGEGVGYATVQDGERLLCLCEDGFFYPLKDEYGMRYGEELTDEVLSFELLPQGKATVEQFQDILQCRVKFTDLLQPLEGVNGLCFDRPYTPSLDDIMSFVSTAVLEGLPVGDACLTLIAIWTQCLKKSDEDMAYSRVCSAIEEIFDTLNDSAPNTLQAERGLCNKGAELIQSVVNMQYAMGERAVDYTTLSLEFKDMVLNRIREEDIPEYQKRCERLAKWLDPRAVMCMARDYLYGKNGRERDLEKAKKFFKVQVLQATGAGLPPGILANILSDEGSTDYLNLLMLYLNSAVYGEDGESVGRISDMVRDGILLPQDHEVALRILFKQLDAEMAKHASLQPLSCVAEIAYRIATIYDRQGNLKAAIRYAAIAVADARSRVEDGDERPEMLELEDTAENLFRSIQKKLPQTRTKDLDETDYFDNIYLPQLANGSEIQVAVEPTKTGIDIEFYSPLWTRFLVASPGYQKADCIPYLKFRLTHYTLEGKAFKGDMLDFLKGPYGIIIIGEKDDSKAKETLLRLIPQEGAKILFRLSRYDTDQED